MEKDNNSDSKKPTWWEKNSVWVLLVGLVFLVLLLWGGCWFLLADAPANSQFSDRGTFGDMFGSVNALFSGLAFAGLICTLIVQMKELKSQRAELELTRKVMEGQKDVMDQQRDQISLQNFESAFFQLFQLRQDSINSLSINSGSGVRSKREAFKASIDFTMRLKGSMLRAEEKSVEVDLDFHKKIHNDHYHGKYADVYYPYENALKSLLLYIDNAPANKEIYTNIVVGSISPNELRALVEIYTSGGNESFNVVLDEYGVFSDMDTSDHAGWLINEFKKAA